MVTPIDRTRYLTLPRPKPHRHLALARLLRKRKPENATPQLEAAHGGLTIAIEEMHEGLLARHFERHGASSAAEDVELDLYVDALWSAVVSGLEHRRVFQRPAVSRLLAQQTEEGFDYAGCVKLAERADQAYRKLFGDERLEFTGLKFDEQSEYMKTLWAVITQEQLEPALAQIVGADIIGALADGQAKYETMVDERAQREQGSSVNLRVLQSALQTRILNYVIAALAMVDDDDPANVAALRAALRPIDALRAQMDRERGRSPKPGTADEADEAEIGELLAEEQAVDESLGGEQGDENEDEDEQG